MPNDSLVTPTEVAAAQSPLDHDLIDAAVSALGAEPDLYVQRGRLVEVRAGRIMPLIDGDIRERLSRSGTWQAFLLLRRRRAFPSWLGRHLVRRRDWPGMRRLRGITAVPVLRPDGSVLVTPGYDAATGLVFAPDADFGPVPEHPTKAEAHDAVTRLKMAFSWFHFATETDLTAFLAALLTPFARYAFEGPAPVFVVDAPTLTCGNSRLVDVIARIITGEPMLRMEKPASEKAFRKQVSKTPSPEEGLLLLEGIDSLRSLTALRAAVERTPWIDGSEKRGDVRPVTWFATSANIDLTHDVRAAAVAIRLACTDDLQLGMTGIVPPDLEARVTHVRRRIVRLALTILRAFRSSGAPAQPIRGQHSFPGWFNFVVGALQWATDGAAPVAFDDAMREAIDDDLMDVRMLARGLIQATEAFPDGVTVVEMLDGMIHGALPDLKWALAHLFPHVKEDPRGLGNLLRRHRGRQVAGWSIRRVGEDRNGYARWAAVMTDRVPPGCKHVVNEPDEADAESAGNEPDDADAESAESETEESADSTAAPASNDTAGSVATAGPAEAAPRDAPAAPGAERRAGSQTPRASAARGPFGGARDRPAGRAGDPSTKAQEPAATDAQAFGARGCGVCGV